MTSIQKIARLLRAPEGTLTEIFAKMEKLTGKIGVADKIFQENQAIVTQKLAELNISPDESDAAKVEAAILQQAKITDVAFFKFLGEPDFAKQSSCSSLTDVLKKTAGVKRGFFLKEEKMRAFLVLNPPRNILAALDYPNVEAMLAKEDIYEIFAALRFVENERWLNEVFFRPYNDLVVDSFEEKDVQIRVLAEKWGEIGAKFVGKKLHNVSHLKEVGLVFIIPVKKENK
ncbi:MAG: hypothetical protein AAB724_02975, partial [Patescibacteria group bacterium]